MASENRAAKAVPKDAEVMMAILKDMGVTEYEPRVVNQMLEFTYKYVTDVLEDAEAYSNHAGKQELDADDVKLAIQTKLDHSFTVPPPRDFILEIAKQKNSLPLPAIKPQNGVRLPPERYCLTSSNFRLKPPRKKTTLTMPSRSSKFPPSSSMTILTKPSGPSFNVKPLSHGGPASSAGSSQGSSKVGMLSLSSAALTSHKRKREDDDS